MYVQDVILAPGTSGVLEIIFGTVCEPGQTILIPRPHFTIYGCLAGALDIKLNNYKLLVRRNLDVGEGGKGRGRGRGGGREREREREERGERKGESL